MSASTPTLELHLNGQPCRVPVGITVAAALQRAGISATRRSVRGEPRAPFCGMGVCQECRVLVNGQRRLACQTVCTEQMTVHTNSAPPAGAQA